MAISDAAWIGDRWAVAWAVECPTCAGKPDNLVATVSRDGDIIAKADVPGAADYRGPSLAWSGDHLGIAAFGNGRTTFRIADIDLRALTPDNEVATTVAPADAIWLGNRFAVLSGRDVKHGLTDLDCAAKAIDIRPHAHVGGLLLPGRALAAVFGGGGLLVEVPGDAIAPYLAVLTYGGDATRVRSTAIGHSQSAAIIATAGGAYVGLLAAERDVVRFVDATDEDHVVANGMGLRTIVDGFAMDDGALPVPVLAWSGDENDTVDVVVDGAMLEIGGVGRGDKRLRLAPGPDGFGVFVTSNVDGGEKGLPRSFYAHVTCH